MQSVSLSEPQYPVSHTHYSTTPLEEIHFIERPRGNSRMDKEPNSKGPKDPEKNHASSQGGGS